MSKRKKKIGRLHILTDDVLQSTFSHVELAQLAIKGGADTIQFRQKVGSTKRRLMLTVFISARRISPSLWHASFSEKGRSSVVLL
jgi:thiamine monophosphate synthase